MNKVNILRLRFENINLFNENTIDIDFTNKMQVKYHYNDHTYFNVFNSVYLPKVMVFNGVNASGKTSILELVQFAFDLYIKKIPLKHSLSSDFLLKVFSNESMNILFYYEQNNVIYKIKTTINQGVLFYFGDEENDIQSNYGHFIANEKIYHKNVLVKTSKATLFTDDYVLLIDRNKLDESQRTFLKNDESIISMVLKDSRQIFHYNNQKNSNITNYRPFSFKKYKTELDPTIIQFLDPSIKSITEKTMLDSPVVGTSGEIRRRSSRLFDISFNNNETYELTELQLLNTLSSGTIRGIQILHQAKEVLKTGGMLIVDELELNFNKSIIIDIIKLFNEHDTNPLNAMLIFSTHYTEIIDYLDRNDQIYIVHRNDKYEIMISNYSDYDKKNQLKKSEAYFADTYDLGTAITYDKYLSLLKSFRGQHEND